MPRRKKPTVPDQPLPQPVKTPRRHARRRRQTDTTSASASSSSSSSRPVGSTSAARKAETRNEILRRKRLLLRQQYLKACEQSFNLVDLPEDVLDKILLHVLDAPTATRRTLENKSLGNWELITNIGASHPVLYKVIAKLVHSIVINPNDIIDPPELVIAADSLKALHIRGHSLTERILHEFAMSGNEQKGPLVRLEGLHLENIDIPTDPFTKIIHQSKSLKSFGLSFTNLPELPSVMTGLLPSFTALRSLKLHGVSNLTGDCIVSICENSKRSLTHLSLRYLRHPSVADGCLYSISKTCLSLTSVDLEHLIHCTQGSIFTLCTFVNDLRSLRLVDLSLSQAQLHKILLHNSATLNELSLEDTISNPTVTDIDLLTDILCMILSSVRASDDISSHLHTLDLRNIPTFTDFHMIRLLESSAHKIRSVTVRHSMNVGDTTCFQLNKHIARTLQYLDLRNCVISDYGLHCLSEDCRHLAALYIGSDGSNVAWHDVGLYNNCVVSNDGLDKVFAACGHKLRHFLWETPRAVLPGDGPIRFHTVGNYGIDAKQLAMSLKSLCKNLLTVEVNWLRPPNNLVAKRAECDLAFFELDYALPRVHITLDREPL